MTNLSLTLACSDYDLTHPLLNGSVKPEGIEIIPLPIIPHERQRRIEFEEFDVAEFSISIYLATKNRGLNYTALPVFPLRQFRHSSIYIHKDGSVGSPKDLKGKRVGLIGYVNSAALWIRGILSREYGVDLSAVSWFTEVEEPRLWTKPESLRITRLSRGTMAEKALEQGEVDALIYPKLPLAFKKEDWIERLFPNYVALEHDFYRRTKLFPIMHVIVVHNRILEQHSWVAWNLVKAFTQAKHICYAGNESRAFYSSTPWLAALLEDQKELLGSDPFPYGFRENRETLSLLVNMAKEQGILSSAEFPLESLFFPNVVQTDLPAAAAHYRV